MSSLFYIGPIMGWNSTEQTRILVDVCEETDLICELIIGNQIIQSFKKQAFPGIPIVYIFYNIPPKSHCRLVWNEKVEIEFLVDQRLRIYYPPDNSFPLVEYIRFDFNEYIPIPPIPYQPSSNEKIVIISGNGHVKSINNMENWVKLSKTRPTIIIHNGYHIYYDDIYKLHYKQILSNRTLWKRIRDKFANAWREDEIRSVMAVNTNILTTDLKPYPNYYLVYLNADKLRQLVTSACSDVSSYINVNMSLNFEETLFLLSLMYQEVLWRDIPREYDGGYKNFLIANKHYFIFDTQFYRSDQTFLGNKQLDYFETSVKFLEPGANIVIIIPGNPIKISSFKRSTPKSREKWGYSKLWISDFLRLINYAQRYKITFIGSGPKELCYELYYNYSGSILRSYILPPIRFINMSKLSPKIRKQLANYSLIYSNIMTTSGYLIIENELCNFITNS